MYNSWPLGKLPLEFQRPEIQQLKDNGYIINDPRDVIELFESKIADYTGAPFAVSVDNCTDALFLVMKYNYRNALVPKTKIPSKTYVSVPQALLQAGFEVEFEDIEWKGLYQLKPFNIYDSAARFTKDMYIQNSEMALSFQIKKRLPIGKGGMILTNSKFAYEWYKRARYEGRDLTVPYDKEKFDMIGWNMYLSPEDCARGILLFDMLTKEQQNFDDMWGSENYPDLIEKDVLNKWSRKF